MPVYLSRHIKPPSVCLNCIRWKVRKDSCKFHPGASENSIIIITACHGTTELLLSSALQQHTVYNIAYMYMYVNQVK